MQVELAIFDPPPQKKIKKRLDRLNQLYWLILKTRTFYVLTPLRLGKILITIPIHYTLFYFS